MTCRRCQSSLSPYLDNALTVPERKQVFVHLSHCTICSKRLQKLENNRQLLRTLPEVEVTAAMESRLWERLHQNKLAMERNSSPAASRITYYVFRIPSSWRDWRIVSVGTLATAAAAVLFYVSTLQSPAEVSAEEVVSSMTQLLDELDPDDGAKILNEEAPEEKATNWQEDFDSWFLDADNDQR